MGWTTTPIALKHSFVLLFSRNVCCSWDLCSRQLHKQRFNQQTNPTDTPLTLHSLYISYIPSSYRFGPPLLTNSVVVHILRHIFENQLTKERELGENRESQMLQASSELQICHYRTLICLSSDWPTGLLQLDILQGWASCKCQSASMKLELGEPRTVFPSGGPRVGDPLWYCLRSSSFGGHPPPKKNPCK